MESATEAAAKSNGTPPAARTPAEFGALIRDEIAKWAEVVKISGAKPD